MKKFLFDILLFLLFAPIIYCIAVIIWGEQIPSHGNIKYQMGTYGHTFSRLSELDTTTHVDVLLLGSSHAYRGFDTRKFDSLGLRAFNMGSSSQTPVQTRCLLNQYLDKLDPELAIIEAFPVTTLELDGVESAIDILANGKVDFNMFVMALKTNHAVVYNTFIYSAYRQFFKLDASFSEERKVGRDTYIQGGFVEKEMMYYQPVPVEPVKNWKMNRRQYCEFKGILKLLESRGVNYLLVQTPVTTAKYQSFNNNSELDELFREQGKYVNFNEIMVLNDSLDFFDSHHMNKNGVEKFSKKLIEELIVNDMIRQ